MKRLLLVLSLAAMLASMMVFSAVPAFAQEDPCEVKDDKTECDFLTLDFERKDDKNGSSRQAGLFSFDTENKLGDKTEQTVTFPTGFTRTTECKVGETCEVTTQPPPS